MPISKGGAGGPTFGPSTATPAAALGANQVSIADATAAQIIMSLVGHEDRNDFLTGVSVHPLGDYSGTGVADSGPVWAEIYLRKAGVSVQKLLAKGYARLAYARGTTSTLGGIGAEPFVSGDVLLANCWNGTGATVVMEMDAETTSFGPGDGSPTPNWTPIVMEPWATYIFEGTVLENSVGGGDHSLTIAPAAGDSISQLTGVIRNGDGAARNATAFLDDGTSGRNLQIQTNTTDTALSIAATTEQVIPSNAAVGEGPQQTPLTVRSPMTYRWTLAAVAQTKTTKFRFLCLMQGRKPVTTLASTGAAPTLTKVRDTVV